MEDPPDLSPRRLGRGPRLPQTCPVWRAALPHWTMTRQQRPSLRSLRSCGAPPSASWTASQTRNCWLALLACRGRWRQPPPWRRLLPLPTPPLLHLPPPARLSCPAERPGRSRSGSARSHLRQSSATGSPLYSGASRPSFPMGPSRSNPDWSGPWSSSAQTTWRSSSGSTVWKPSPRRTSCFLPTVCMGSISPFRGTTWQGWPCERMGASLSPSRFATSTHWRSCCLNLRPRRGSRCSQAGQARRRMMMTKTRAFRLGRGSRTLRNDNRRHLPTGQRIGSGTCWTSGSTGRRQSRAPCAKSASHEARHWPSWKTRSKARNFRVRTRAMRRTCSQSSSSIAYSK
mmetsp:Transcript_25312/g.80495  ORF Transcript_25312/g.80495 Transcript_25312/m.80495 type:complete len:343 (+) Transcript_25312:644-1672(+)